MARASKAWHRFGTLVSKIRKFFQKIFSPKLKCRVVEWVGKDVLAPVWDPDPPDPGVQSGTEKNRKKFFYVLAFLRCVNGLGGSVRSF